MDFQKYVDAFEMACAVLSVQKVEGEQRYGEIRIVCSNAAYKKIMGGNVPDGIRYDEMIPKERNFEEFCYNCAVLKKHLHAYVDTKAMGVWTDGTYIPLSSDVDYDDLCHFAFFFEFTKGPDEQRMTDVSVETASFVIQTCLKLRGTDNYQDTMNEIMVDIQKRTDSFAACILLIDKEKKRYSVLCEKFRNDESKMENYADILTYEIIESWEEMFKETNIIFIKDEFDFKQLEKINPAWAKSLKSGSAHNVILAPLVYGKNLLGYLFITNYNTEESVEIKEIIELISFFLSSEIASNNLMEQLEYMSNVDFLTGVKNRNSMNARVDYHVNNYYQVKAPYGVAFLDLNGLKQCNDSGGHEAGDALLKKAAELLKKEFEDDEIYRAGGDEFVIIIPECIEADFNEKIADLKKKAGYGCEVCFAVGSDWNDGTKDLRLCMHNADESMYADKREFYKEHPELARK